ncbi:MAG TPA: YitT family protein, partial [Clostridia bacterium]|nr:YitT family protein [Clostridia bacterium]
MMKRDIRELFFVVLGALLSALSFDLFLVPHEIAPGGIAGVATFFHYLLGVPVGTMILSINIPIFLIGLKYLGWSFGFRTALGTLLL